MLTLETLSGPFFLSSNQDKESNYAFLKAKLEFIPQPIRPYYDYYLNYFDSFQEFPSFDCFKQAVGLELTPQYDINTSEKMYKKIFSNYEVDFLSQQLVTAAPQDKRAIVQRLDELTKVSTTSAKELSSSSNFQLEGSLIKEGSKIDNGYLLWHTKHLNERAPMRPGYVITILGAPGSAKSGLALTLVYENSLAPNRKFNSLYTYGENVEATYQAEVRSRFSYDIGINIENLSLKNGIYKDDPTAVEKVKELESKFQALDHGNVYFLPMSDLPKEPYLIGSYISYYINRYNISLVLFDHLQCMLAWKPMKWDKTEFLNMISNQMRATALGLMGAQPCVTIVLSQINREQQVKQERTNKISMGSAYSCSALDQDSYVVISTVATPESKQANLITNQILKNRDGPVDLAPLPCPALMQYCKYGDIGDSADLAETYSNTSMDDLFSFDSF